VPSKANSRVVEMKKLMKRNVPAQRTLDLETSTSVLQAIHAETRLLSSCMVVANLTTLGLIQAKSSNLIKSVFTDFTFGIVM
jgi:hypothetical protein